MNIDEITLKEIMEIYIEEHNIINFDISVLEFGGDTENNRNYQKVKVKQRITLIIHDNIYNYESL